MKRQSRCETKSIAPEHIETLVILLSGRVRLLASDIEAEEERTRCKDRQRRRILDSSSNLSRAT